MSSNDKSEKIVSVKKSGGGGDEMTITNSQYLTIISGRMIMGNRTNVLKVKQNLDPDSQEESDGKLIFSTTVAYFFY